MTISVALGKFSSSTTVFSGIPQGSILSPLIFNIYILPLEKMTWKHNVSLHFYADHTLIYLPLTLGDSILPLMDCLENIKQVVVKYISLNKDKTEIIIFGPPKLKSGLINELGNHVP